MTATTMIVKNMSADELKALVNSVLLAELGSDVAVHPDANIVMSADDGSNSFIIQKGDLDFDACLCIDTQDLLIVVKTIVNPQVEIVDIGGNTFIEDLDLAEEDGQYDASAGYETTFDVLTHETAQENMEATRWALSLYAHLEDDETVAIIAKELAMRRADGSNATILSRETNMPDVSIEVAYIDETLVVGVSAILVKTPEVDETGNVIGCKKKVLSLEDRLPLYKEAPEELKGMFGIFGIRTLS